MNIKANKTQVSNFPNISFRSCPLLHVSLMIKCPHIRLLLSLPSGMPVTIFCCDAGWFCTLPRDWHSKCINNISMQEISGTAILSPPPNANPPARSCLSGCALIPSLCDLPPCFTDKYPCLYCLQLLKPRRLRCSSQKGRCRCCLRNMAVWALQTFWNHGAGLG